MRIRTRLYILAAVAIGLAAALGVVTFRAAGTVGEKTRTHQLAHEMQTAVFNLNLLTYRYLDGYDPAVEQEWESLYHDTAVTVGEDLDVAARAEYALYGDLFWDLTISYKHEQRLAEAGAPEEDIRAAVLAREELVPRLLDKSGSVVAVASEISDASFAELIAAQERERNLTLGLSLSMAGAVAIAAAATAGRITQPLSSLAEYTRRVGRGDYTAGVNVVGKDEIAEITSDVRAMVEKLLETQQKLLLTNSAIESSTTGIAISDLEGNLTYVNPAFLEIFGYRDAGEVVGRPAAGFWREPARAKRVIEALVNQNRP